MQSKHPQSACTTQSASPLHEPTCLSSISRHCQAAPFTWTCQGSVCSRCPSVPQSCSPVHEPVRLCSISGQHLPIHLAQSSFDTPPHTHSIAPCQRFCMRCASGTAPHNQTHLSMSRSAFVALAGSTSPRCHSHASCAAASTSPRWAPSASQPTAARQAACRISQASSAPIDPSSCCCWVCRDPGGSRLLADPLLLQGARTCWSRAGSGGLWWPVAFVTPPTGGRKVFGCCCSL